MTAQEINAESTLFNPLSEDEIFEKRKRRDLAVNKIQEYVTGLENGLDQLRRRLDTRLDQMQEVVDASTVPAAIHSDIDEMVQAVAAQARDGDQVVIMSNGGFAGIHQQLLSTLEGRL